MGTGTGTGNGESSDDKSKWVSSRGVKRPRDPTAKVLVINWRRDSLAPLGMTAPNPLLLLPLPRSLFPLFAFSRQFLLGPPTPLHQLWIPQASGHLGNSGVGPATREFLD